MKEKQLPDIQGLERQVYKKIENKDNAESTKEFVLTFVKPMGMEYFKRIEKVLAESSKITEKKFVLMTFEQIAKHYAPSEFEKDGTPSNHYPGLIRYLSGKETYVMICQDQSIDQNKEQIDFVGNFRKSVIGSSNPRDNKIGQIRHIPIEEGLDFQKQMYIPELSITSLFKDNLIHCSDSVESAVREIEIWFPEVAPKYQKIFENIKKQKTNHNQLT